MRSDLYPTLGKGLTRVHTDDELAKKASMSSGQMHKVKAIAERAPEAVKPQLRTGQITINRAYQELQTAAAHREPRAWPRCARWEPATTPKAAAA